MASQKHVFISYIIDRITIELLREMGYQVTYWDQPTSIPYQDLLSHTESCHAIVSCGSERLDLGFFDNCQNLEIISQSAAGFENIDTQTASSRGIPICNVGDATAEATADIAFALMIATGRKMLYHHKNIFQGTWSKLGRQSDLGLEFKNKTLGIVGLGHIGSAMAQRCKGAYNMNILYHNRSRNKHAEKALGAQWVELDELLKQSDVVSAHCSLNASTRGLFNLDSFRKMKPSALFINTSRGGVVVQNDLRVALDEGLIWGAGLDVTDPEPMDPKDPLLQMERATVMPHIGSATFDTRRLMAKRGAENVINFYRDGSLENLVNPDYKV